MPLREYECASCGHRQDELFQDSNYPGTVDCEECGSQSTFKFSPALYRMDFRDGYDISAGAYFSTKKERENYISKKGLRRLRD